eukprot:Em0018g534a
MGYSKQHDSWEPEENLVSCDELVQEYERTLSSINKTASNSEIPNVPRINDDHSNDSDAGVAKPKRGRPSKHMKDSKSKQKAESTTTASPNTPQLTKEAEVNRYNLRSASKRYVSVELQDDNQHILTSNTSMQPGEFLTNQASLENIHKPEPDASATEISQVKTRLELKFDCKEAPQMQLISSFAVTDRTKEHPAPVSSVAVTDETKELDVSVPAATKVEEHLTILHKKDPSRIDHAEYYFALSIVLIGILGYLLTI